LLPVSVTAWFVNRNSAFGLSVLSAFIWTISNQLAGESYSHPGIIYWNSVVRLGFFSIVSLLLTYLRQAVQKERELSRTDFLTGITNSRAFYELTSSELLRAKRYQHPITVAYMDVDNFKQINDQLGHSVGDLLLKTIAETMSKNLRRTDIMARLGGDEFVVLLPETTEKAAKIAITKLRTSLSQTMEKNRWGVTFSIGTITFYAYPSSTDELLQQVDELMYTVKTNGKNNVKFARAG
jgi:diguanylate cyclase (GGDEF)-like protein